MRDILFLAPVFKQMIWGGNKLNTEWGYEIPGDNTGECWAITARDNGDSVILNGEYKGETLSKLWKEHPELFGNLTSEGEIKNAEFPLLVKILDSAKDLSIQVHPDDDYARANENGSMGKSECWYILDAPEDASLIIGHNAATKEELKDMIHSEKWNELIRRVPIKKGDFIQIDAGTVHSILEGFQIYEVQENADITYRVYDYDRIDGGKKRELHIDKSIDVIKVPAPDVSDMVRNVLDIPSDIMHELVDCDKYRVWKISVLNGLSFDMNLPFMIMSVIEGCGLVNGIKVSKGDHFILPCGIGKVTLEGKMNIIASAQ